MPGMMNRATPTRKPTPKPTATKKAATKPKPKNVPVPKFTPPTVDEFRRSAAYKTDSMMYKEYVDYFRQQHNYKYKKK
jgi:hypothetical protein